MGGTTGISGGEIGTPVIAAGVDAAAAADKDVVKTCGGVAIAI